ncbi:uncharacterized protein METZ01_LOCUS494091 [marine metagenome]|uniref:Uncharacterized protein n=1 Tax=marine metagenome TaxID=408172 RepID=A0A383D9P1_9ZZZZ
MIRKMNVIDKTWVWVVFKSSLMGLGYFSGISKSSSMDDPLKCSLVPSADI